MYMPKELQGKAWKFARPFFGPYEVLQVTPSNVSIRLWNRPEAEPIFVSIDRVCKANDQLGEDVWTGRTTQRRPRYPRKRREKGGPATATATGERHQGPVTRSQTRRQLQDSPS